ncbi:YdcF family protein [Gloeobacter morelensis]|uniref:YdcF family protein n=1 Tax=Gloeobacter morelensis MG652769 TaxID=2781736 RepID=A0ABY3PJ21_9CYAN|nr:YdcF family protein [Gloeobacter morelensis]UFP93623.1 YdcF family protein [Gloeobacter morelensis MG652769]
MIDPALCMRAPEGWTVFTVWLLDWLANPWLVVAPLALLLAAPWWIRPLPWKIPISAVAIALLLVYFAAVSPPAMALADAQLADYSEAPANLKADAIVVLGRGERLRRTRVELAARLWRAGRAPRIFISGRHDADAMVADLRRMGLPAKVVAGEECSRTTQENAEFTARLLKPAGVRTLLLVTDAPHMLRSLRTFKEAGFNSAAVTSPFPEELSELRERLIVVREYLGLLTYRWLGRIEV